MEEDELDDGLGRELCWICWVFRVTSSSEHTVLHHAPNTRFATTKRTLPRCTPNLCTFPSFRPVPCRRGECLYPWITPWHMFRLHFGFSFSFATKRVAILVVLGEQSFLYLGCCAISVPGQEVYSRRSLVLCVKCRSESSPMSEKPRGSFFRRFCLRQNVQL